MIWLGITVGILTGIISGFGVGGGSLLVLYLTAVMGVAQYTASGVNLLYFLCCAPTALWSHIRQKRVDWQAVIWCAAVGAVTSVGAAFAASYLPSDLLRRLFGGLLLYIGVRELFFAGKASKKVTKK